MIGFIQIWNRSKNLIPALNDESFFFCGEDSYSRSLVFLSGITDRYIVVLTKGDIQMNIEDNNIKVKDQEDQLNTSSQEKPGKIADPVVLMEIVYNIIFAIPIVIYWGIKLAIKKMEENNRPG
jgi:hypothetical protein